MNTSKGGDSSGDGGDSSSSSAEYLKHLNKISHKISKSVRKPPVYENRSLQSSQFEIRDLQSQPASAAAEVAHSLLQQQQHHPAPPQQQPPVYNINKSDFRDVVQKLTGSPAHERISTPPPIQHPKQQSSRLQRIRPPPLAQIGNRPASLVPANPRQAGVGFVCGQRPAQAQPLSPLPPFPAVHAAAESPISAYMRFLQNSFNGTGLDSKRFSSGPPPHAPLASPRWNGLAPPPQHHPLFPPQQQNIPPPASSSSAALQQYPAMPSSPLPFSCLPSPRSPCALLSPNLLHSPVGQLGFPQLPLSPTVPLSSPTWKGI
ncbi:unnamed protein product [Cuscuta campestris]|uniref:VQ domain-containing protein n=1 Tax=Cuscuta campestris TaxID=132261 RepID=A0A484LXV1_9ASTE|nr:unnamed protein product [Cuscuta campestris]